MTEATDKAKGGGITGTLRRPIEALVGPLTRENGATWVKLIVIILVVQWLFIEPFRIPSASMEPTLRGRGDYLRDDRVAVNKLAYGVRIPFTNVPVVTWGEPRRWDIVVFRSVEPPPSDTSPLRRLFGWVRPKILIKRVVGLPGERIHIADGCVYVDGAPLDLPDRMPPVYYTSQSPGFQPYVEAPIAPGAYVRIPQEDRMRYGVRSEDEYAVVPPGCYLVLGDNSDDSEDGRYFGWVPQENVLGRAFAVWWPLGRWRDLTGFTEHGWGKLLLFGLPTLLILLELVSVFVVRTWKIRGNPIVGELRRGDRLWVNCLAFGLRAPYMRRRLTAWRPPRRGELVLYRAPRKTEWEGALLLGRVAALPGDPVPEAPADDSAPGTVPEAAYYIEAAEDPRDPDSGVLGCIPRENLVGSVESIWWPLTRRRSLEAGPAVPMADDGA